MLIVVEGLDGVGKTTFTEALKAALIEHGINTIIYRQPGGTPLAEELRSLVKYSKEPMSIEVQTALFLTARMQLLSTRVLPALKGGNVVILDRHNWSTLAYQGDVLPELMELCSRPAPNLYVYIRDDKLIGHVKAAQRSNECCNLNSEDLKVLSERQRKMDLLAEGADNVIQYEAFRDSEFDVAARELAIKSVLAKLGI